MILLQKTYISGSDSHGSGSVWFHARVDHTACSDNENIVIPHNAGNKEKISILKENMYLFTNFCFQELK